MTHQSPVTRVCAAVAVTIVVFGGCRTLPNPDADDFIRAMRMLDKAQRPNGDDLPMERFVAWQSRRDTGRAAPPELTRELEILADHTHEIVNRLDALEIASGLGRSVIGAYRSAHESARHGLEDVLSGRRMGTKAQVARGEQRARKALDSLREARALRKRIAGEFGVPE